MKLLCCGHWVQNSSKYLLRLGARYSHFSSYRGRNPRHAAHAGCCWTSPHSGNSRSCSPSIIAPSLISPGLGTRAQKAEPTPEQEPPSAALPTAQLPGAAQQHFPHLGRLVQVSSAPWGITAAEAADCRIPSACTIQACGIQLQSRNQTALSSFCTGWVLLLQLGSAAWPRSLCYPPKPWDVVPRQGKSLAEQIFILPFTVSHSPCPCTKGGCREQDGAEQQ